MKLFKKREHRNYEELIAEAREVTRRKIEEEKAREQELINKIGKSTDGLADEALRVVEHLPDNQKNMFLRNVFRRLVVQALHTAKALDDEHVQGLEYQTLHDFGEGLNMIVLPGSLQRAVINESLPTYHQDELNFNTDEVVAIEYREE